MTTSFREKLAADWKWGTLSKDNAALALGELAEFDDDEVKALLEEAKFKEPVNGRFLSWWLGWLCLGRLYKGDKHYVAIYFAVIAVLVALSVLIAWLFPNVSLFDLGGKPVLVGFIPMLMIVLLIFWHCSMDGQFVFVGIQKDNMKKFLATLEKYKAKKGKK